MEPPWSKPGPHWYRLERHQRPPRAADLRRLDEPGWISLEAPHTTHVETRTAQDDETRERLADELARATERMTRRQTNVFTEPYDGARIPGGCDHCDAPTRC